jgi:SAM-dependent methyltransferase
MTAVNSAEFWDGEAGAFDQQPDHGLDDPSVRAAWSGLLLPLLPALPARIADIGCGTASVSLLLAEAGHRVFGLDISPAMVARAREKFATSGYSADILVGDAAAPPWTPGSFEVVITRHVLWAMPDPDAALIRWLDLLAPGGILILVEGLWWTGAGISAAQVSELVLRHRVAAEVTMLDDASFWGGPIRDERFITVSRR